MRECKLFALFLLFCLPASTQAAPEGWKPLKDAKGTCQISVPPEWVPFSESSGAAVFHDATTAIAVVTSQPGQAFKPMPDSLLKILEIRKEKLFENSAKRAFYQDRTSRNSEDPNAFSSSVPSKGGTCSCRVVFLPSITEEVARKIALSLAPAPE
jgi:hypothetical protein